MNEYRGLVCNGDRTCARMQRSNGPGQGHFTFLGPVPDRDLRQENLSTHDRYRSFRNGAKASGSGYDGWEHRGNVNGHDYSMEDVNAVPHLTVHIFANEWRTNHTCGRRWAGTPYASGIPGSRSQAAVRH
ncbi:hypothetical protein BW737_006025 [Actinomyces ruminis]|uniref:Uncharacterized protein n=1 Tax=Actinomyces ruminis TaxID=1937003 RepID=A0ABX4MBU6_9ACTO|nr:hypothetical protein BW737_006025 [Actinomyces ruminis]